MNRRLPPAEILVLRVFHYQAALKSVHLAAEGYGRVRLDAAGHIALTQPGYFQAAGFIPEHGFRGPQAALRPQPGLPDVGKAAGYGPFLPGPQFGDFGGMGIILMVAGEVVKQIPDRGHFQTAQLGGQFFVHPFQVGYWRVHGQAPGRGGLLFGDAAARFGGSGLRRRFSLGGAAAGFGGGGLRRRRFRYGGFRGRAGLAAVQDSQPLTGPLFPFLRGQSGVGWAGQCRHSGRLFRKGG